MRDQGEWHGFGTAWVTWATGFHSGGFWAKCRQSKPAPPHVATSPNLADFINEVNVKLASKVEAHLTEIDAIVNETQGTHT